MFTTFTCFLYLPSGVIFFFLEIVFHSKLYFSFIPLLTFPLSVNSLSFVWKYIYFTLAFVSKRMMQIYNSRLAAIFPQYIE